MLIIDEAQHLSTDVLEEIRVLSNLETNDQKLLQIVIVGQLNLLDVLHKAELRQLDQRISIRCSLKALTREEVEAYVTHRLWVARGSTSVSFTPKAFDLVHVALGRRAARDQPALRSIADDARARSRRAGSPRSTWCMPPVSSARRFPKARSRGTPRTARPVPSRRGPVLAVLLLVILLAATAAASR